MGYEIHITRKEHWSDEEEPTISLDEWKAYIRGDSEMRLGGFAEAIVGDGSKLRVEVEGLAVWTAYSEHEINGMAWFGLFEGEVHVKNTDTEILQKMWRIAEKLGARVQGDEGEFYDSSGQVDDSLEFDTPAIAIKKPWWKFW